RRAADHGARGGRPGWLRAEPVTGVARAETPRSRPPRAAAGHRPRPAPLASLRGLVYAAPAHDRTGDPTMTRSSRPPGAFRANGCPPAARRPPGGADRPPARPGVGGGPRPRPGAGSGRLRRDAGPAGPAPDPGRPGRANPRPLPLHGPRDPASL